MADTKITALAAIATVDPAADVLPIVDISDTSMAASGTTKKVTSNQILGAGGTATLASATITGDLTVDTSTLKVDSTNNRVIVGHTSGSAAFQVTNAGAAGLEIQPTGFSSAPLIQSYNRSGSAYTQLTLDASTIVHALSGTTAMTLNSTGLGIGASPTAKLHVLNTSLSGTTAGSNVIATLRSNGSGYDSFLQFSDNVAYNAGLGMLAGNLYFYTGGAERLRLDAGGNLLVGTTGSLPSFADGRIEVLAAASSYCIVADATATSAAAIGIRGNDSTVAASFYNASTGGTVGSIVINSGGVSYNTTSDYRLKESVKPISGGLARVNALKPSIYNWKSNGSTGEGFIAHELAEVVPFAVSGEKDAMNADGTIKSQGIDMSRIVPILVAAIQELTAEVNALKNA